MHATSSVESIGKDPMTRPARRPMRRTTLISWVVFGFAVGFFVLFLIQAGTFDALTEYPDAPAPTGVTQEKVVVQTSSISGFDREQQPYTVNAQSAVQDPDKPNIIRLNTVSGKLQKSTGKVFTIDGKKGVYDSDSKTLDLAGDVHIISVGRFVATMAKARVTLLEKQLRTDDSVVVKFDTGDISADGLKITNDGKNIEFLSRVKVRLRAAASKQNKDGND